MARLRELARVEVDLGWLEEHNSTLVPGTSTTRAVQPGFGA